MSEADERTITPDDAPIEAQADADAVAAQRLNAEVAVKVGEARRMMDVDPERAIQTLRETLTAVKAADVPEAAQEGYGFRVVCEFGAP